MLRKLILSLFFFIFLSGIVWAASEYTIVELNNGNSVSEYAVSQTNNFVAWRAYDGSDYEIFKYDGSSVIQITDNEFDDTSVRINNNGIVVWSGWDGSDYEIFKYDGSSVIQITDNEFDDTSPRLNNNGQIAWLGSNQSSDNSNAIFFYNGSSIIQVTYDEIVDYIAHIGDNGHIVWRGFDGSDYELFKYDGSSVIQLTDNEDRDVVSIRVNKDGDIAWMDQTNLSVTWPERGKNVFLYDGFTTTKIYEAGNLNIQGLYFEGNYIAWQSWIFSTWYYFLDAFYLYDGNSVEEIADGYLEGLNDSGKIVWNTYGNSRRQGVYLYDGAESIELVKSQYCYGGSINNANMIVWQDGSGEKNIYLYDGLETTRITTDEDVSTNWEPQIYDDNKIVWSTGTKLYIAIPEGNQAPEEPILPDTAQTTCYDNTGSIITCPAEGDAFYGQDAQYGPNAQSFTKLDNSGAEIPDSAIEWQAVKDNSTGLIWTASDGGRGFYWYEVETYINELNSNNFGGFSDWRVPTIFELFSLLDFERSTPKINSLYFNNSYSTYWSSTFCAKTAYTQPSAWVIDFSNGSTSWGIGNWYSGSTRHHGIRAVRGETLNHGVNLASNNNGTITDADTGLMWEQHTQGPMTWQEALDYCEKLRTGGYTDWRLPNIKEILSLNDYRRYAPSINEDFFPDPNVANVLYGFLGQWSSTTNNLYPQEAFISYLYNGSTLSKDKKTTQGSDTYYFVRAVRSINTDDTPTDSDGDGTPDDQDGCPNDPGKINPGTCGCGSPDTVTDNGETDCDGDNLPDEWEQQIIDADPDDGIESISDVLPDDDFDGDGLYQC